MDLSGYRYMVIDDDAFTCKLLSRLLQKYGADEAVTMSNGKEAIARINATDMPDVIICDLNMPEVDGIEFVHFLGQELFRGGLVLISGSDKSILNAVMKLAKSKFINVLGTLSKPFTPQEVLDVLARFGNDKKSLPG